MARLLARHLLAVFGQVTAETASLFAVVRQRRPAEVEVSPGYLAQALAVSLLRITATLASSALRVEQGGWRWIWKEDAPAGRCAID